MEESTKEIVVVATLVILVLIFVIIGAVTMNYTIRVFNIVNHQFDIKVTRKEVDIPWRYVRMYSLYVDGGDSSPYKMALKKDLMDNYKFKEDIRNNVVSHIVVYSTVYKVTYSHDTQLVHIFNIDNMCSQHSISFSCNKIFFKEKMHPGVIQVLAYTE